MENAPVMLIAAWRIQPEYRERASNWLMEVFMPMNVNNNPHNQGQDRYQITSENPDYVRNISFIHYKNSKAIENARKIPENKALVEDLRTWIPRREAVWGTYYRLLKYFRNDRAGYWADNSAAKVAESPFIHIEGYRLPVAEEEKYGMWLNQWGYELHIPLIMRLPGLVEYDCYRVSDFPVLDIYKVEEADVHPAYLSILHFENLKAYEDYEKSKELAALRYALRVPFPRGLDYKWYVQYQLMKSLRK